MMLDDLRWSAVLLLVSALALAPALPLFPGTPEATESGSPLQLSEDERWTELLSGSRARQLFGSEENAGPPDQAEIRRRRELVLAVTQGHDGLTTEGERERLSLDLYYDRIEAAYVEQVLVPSLEIGRDEALEVYERQREGHHHQPAVRLLEIFVWAPTDLPELRQSRRELLETLRTEATTPEAFAAAAERHSDAASRGIGGSIGSVQQGQVSDDLWKIVSAVESGPTEIAGGRDGLYLFFVLGHVAPREADIEKAVDAIMAGLRRRALPARIEQERERLARAHDLVLPAADAEPESAIAFTVGGAGHRLDAIVAPGTPAETASRAVERRAWQVLCELELRRLDRLPPIDVEPEYRLALYRMIMEQLVDQRCAGPGLEPYLPQARPSTAELPKLSRWTFDLLVVDDGAGGATLFQLFRILHELGSEADLEAVRQHLAVTGGPMAEIRRFDNVPESEAIGLGMEIHSTLDKYLRPGEISRPLHVENRGSFVIVALHSRTVDVAASELSHERQVAARARELCRRALESDLMASEDPQAAD